MFAPLSKMGTKEGITKNGGKGFNKNEGDAQDIG
jgi:hypothetical protein